MTQFETIKNLNIKQFAQFLEDMSVDCDTPWDRWVEEVFCANCQHQKVMMPDCWTPDRVREVEVPPCEVGGEMGCPHNVYDKRTVEIIERWLNSEVNN